MTFHDEAAAFARHHAVCLEHPEQTPTNWLRPEHYRYLANLADWAVKAEEVLREVIATHADPESPFYNDCHEGELCAWCEGAIALLAARPKEPKP